MNFTIYNNTGLIIRTGSCPDGMETIQAMENELVVNESADCANDYVLNGVVTPRPANTAELDNMKIINIPQNSKIIINRVEYPCNDTVVELDLTYPGNYTITVKSFPWLDKTFNVVKE